MPALFTYSTPLCTMGAGWLPLLAPSCMAQLHTRRRSLTFCAVI